MENSFHPTTGRCVRLEGREAIRDNTQFENGLCYSKQPLKKWSPFTFAISGVTTRWRGGMVVGVMATNPDALDLRRQPPACHPIGLDDVLQRKQIPFVFVKGLTQAVSRDSLKLLSYGVSNTSCRQVREEDGAAVECRTQARRDDVITVLLGSDNDVFCCINDKVVMCLGRFAHDASDLHVVIDMNASTVSVELKPPLYLLDMCRTVIRQSLCEPNLADLAQLPLPGPLISFLRLLPPEREEKSSEPSADGDDSATAPTSDASSAAVP